MLDLISEKKSSDKELQIERTWVKRDHHLKSKILMKLAQI